MTYKHILLTLFALTLLQGCGSSESSTNSCEKQIWSDTTEVIYNITGTEDSKSNPLPPPEFVAVTAQPQPLSIPKPIYPVEVINKYSGRNKIWTKLWLSKDGKVQLVKVKKCEPADVVKYVVEAAKKAVFSPAKTASGNVEVWVSIPYLYP